MLLKLLLLLVTLAPVPAPPPPDPVAGGYLGVGRSADPAGDLVVGRVVAGQAADRGGLRAGDVLVTVGPLRPVGFDDMAEYVYGVRPGTPLRVEVRRAGRPVVLTVVVGARPADLGPPVLADRGGDGRPRLDRLPPIPPNR